jgi:hypothetical protein
MLSGCGRKRQETERCEEAKLKQHTGRRIEPHQGVDRQVNCFSLDDRRSLSCHVEDAN